jgi:predicted transcriptional regulator
MSDSGRPYKKAAYEQAISLRKRGFSYSEIAKLCAVSVGTVSAWLSPLAFSKGIKEQNKRRAAESNIKRLLVINKARATERRKQYAEAERLAKVEYQNYRQNPLFMAGLMLYVTAGDNLNPSLIRLTNSRPELHRIFIKFIVRYLGVEKGTIRFWLLLYPDHAELPCIQHWTKKTGLSVSQFYKNQYVKSRSQNHPLHFGIGNTIIGSTLLKKKLNQWIELALRECNK